MFHLLLLCEGNPLMNGVFASQRVNDPKSVSTSWRNYEALPLTCHRRNVHVSFCDKPFLCMRTEPDLRGKITTSLGQ